MELSALLNKLDQLLATDQNEEAVRLGLQAYEHHSGSTHLVLSLSEACRRTSRLRQARDLAGSAYQADSTDPFVLAQYARCLMPFADHGAMLPLLSRGLNMPAQAWSDEILATCAVSLDEWSLALGYYDRLLLNTPANAPGKVGYRYMQALCKSILGYPDETKIQLRELTRQYPFMGRAWWTLADMALPDIDRQTVAQLLSDPVVPLREKVYLYQVQGQLAHHNGHYADAFVSWAAANQIKKQFVSYSPRQWDALFAALTESNFSAGQAVCDAAPVFIIGLPRSGSTLVEQLLLNSGELTGAGELRDVEVAVHELLGLSPEPMPFTELIAKVSGQEGAGVDLSQLGFEYARRTENRRANNQRICDKNPFNFFWVDLLARALPNARFVHVYKNPLDAGIGLFRHQFAAVATWSYDLNDMAHFYIHYYRLMQVWQSRYPQQLYSLSYEDLLNNPDAVMGRLYDWLGLTYSSQNLTLTKERREVRSASANQVRRGINKGALGIARHYQSELAPFRHALEQAGINLRPAE